MLLKEGITINHKFSDEDMAVFDGGTFGGRKALSFILLFADGMFCKGSVIFHPKEHEVIRKYEEWVKDLSEKYGKPDDSFHHFLNPYSKGDGHETTAIRVGKGTFMAIWRFPVPNSEPNVLGVRITDSLAIRLAYEQGALMTRFTEQRKQKQRKDY